MLAGAALDAALAALPTAQFDDVLCRAVTNAALHDPSYSPNALYCNGAPTSGARFTSIGGPPSIYFAEDKETAWAEVHQPYLAVQRSNRNAAIEPPTVLYYARVKLDRVLDVTDAAVQAALGTNIGELAAPYLLFQAMKQLAPTQILGEAVSRTGCAQAIRYLSVAGTTYLSPAKYCYVIFCGLVQPPNFVEIIDPSGALAKRIP